MSGLCSDGAWEVAISAIRSADLTTLEVPRSAEPDRSSAASANSEDLRDASQALAEVFANFGPAAGGSAAAASGALAAGLLERTANLSQERGPLEFRKRSGDIAKRATILQLTLSTAAQTDADAVQQSIEARVSDDPTEALQEAIDSLIEIASRCSQVATFAAEIARNDYAPVHFDAMTTLRLAASACECALELTQSKLDPETALEAWDRDAKRRIWRTNLVLNRAALVLRDKEHS